MRDKLWLDIQAGSEQSLIELYELLYKELYNYGMRISRNEELTRDSIQDLFAQIWERKIRLKDTSDPKPYLFRVFRNILLDALKKLNRYSFKEDVAVDIPVLSSEDITINKEVSQRQHQLLMKAIDQLTSSQKEIIYLKYFSGLTYDEIAEITSTKNQSIRNLFSKAMKELRNSMTSWLLF